MHAKSDLTNLAKAAFRGNKEYLFVDKIKLAKEKITLTEIDIAEHQYWHDDHPDVEDFDAWRDDQRKKEGPQW